MSEKAKKILKVVIILAICFAAVAIIVTQGKAAMIG
jgi:hypothetical protein